MICEDCFGSEDVGFDRVCIECRKCRDQIPMETLDPEWSAWLEPIFDIYGPRT